MITKERLNEFIATAYKTACDHGFHDEEKGNAHWMMLVVSEVGEMMEADRAGRYHFSKTLRPKMATEEEWKPVTCCSGYEVSNFGRVRSLDMRVWNGKTYYTKKGRELKAGLSGTGYLTVCLHSQTHKVSILVADAFLERKSESDVVNHIDGNKLNNNVGNLEFVSQSDNNYHAIKTGLRSYGKKLSYEDDVYIALEHKKGRAYTSIFKDRNWPVTKSAIQKVCKEYKKYTDSVEFETADVCIRLFDFLGMKGIEPETFEEKKDDWQNMFASLSVCEQCYELVQGITIIGNDSTPNEIAKIAGAMILFCFDFAEQHGFDLEWHIVHKMKYNERRAKLHGKSY